MRERDRGKIFCCKHTQQRAEDLDQNAALVEDYETTYALEEESIAVALFEHMKIQEQNGGLFCPICRKGYLNQQRQFIYYEWCQLKLHTQNLCEQSEHIC